MNAAKCWNFYPAVGFCGNEHRRLIAGDCGGAVGESPRRRLAWWDAGLPDPYRAEDSRGSVSGPDSRLPR